MSMFSADVRLDKVTHHAPDTDATVTKELSVRRHKSGECPECGNKLFHMKGILFKKKVPLSTETAKSGRCLLCKPLSAPLGGAAPPSSSSGQKSMDNDHSNLRSESKEEKEQGRGDVVAEKKFESNSMDCTAAKANILEIISSIVEDPSHAIDSDRAYSKIIHSINRPDWETKGKGLSCDADRAIFLAQGKSESGEELLIIRHIDTATLHDNSFTRKRFDKHPPVWALALTTAEFKTIKEAIEKGFSNRSNRDDIFEDVLLIHREPPHEIDPQKISPWYEESSWLVENKKVTGVRMAVKATQDKVPTVAVVRFVASGRTFRFIGDAEDITESEQDDIAKRFLAARKSHKLPEPFYAGPKPIELCKEKAIRVRTLEEEKDENGGDLPISIEHDSDNISAEHFTANRESNAINQKLRSGKLTITNLSEDKSIKVKDVYAEIKHEGTKEKFLKCMMLQGGGKESGTKLGLFKEYGYMHGVKSARLFQTDEATRVTYHPPPPHYGAPPVAYSATSIASVAAFASSATNFSPGNVASPHTPTTAMSTNMHPVTTRGDTYTTPLPTMPHQNQVGLPPVHVMTSNPSHGVAAQCLANVAALLSTARSIGLEDNDTSFILGPGQKVHLVVDALFSLEDAIPHATYALRLMLHRGLPDLVTVRVTFVGESGQTKAISWDYSNKPMLHRVKNYEELLAVPEEQGSEKKHYSDYTGIGEDFRCDLWLHVDDPCTLERNYVIITSAKENADRWYVRFGDTDGRSEATITMSVCFVAPDSLKRIAYDAKKNGSSTVDVTEKWQVGGGNHAVKMVALVDTELEVVYGVRAEINVGNGKIISSKSMYLDQARVRKL